MIFDKSKLKSIGKDVYIGEHVKITNPELVEIGDYVRIDDFTVIAGKVKIGRFVHIASFVSITGGGELIIDEFVGFAAGCRILTGTDDFSGRCLLSPCVPKKYKTFAVSGITVIKKHVILGANTIVLPNVTINEGTVTGAGTVVLKDLLEWGIYVGQPAIRKSLRSKELLKIETEFLKEL